MMFLIRSKKTGWFMCGFCLWTPDREVALAFRSETGAHAVHVFLNLRGEPVEVVRHEA